MTGCLALTEPEAGSDATALKTRAEKQLDGKHTINGQKLSITAALIADVFTVFARTDDRARGDSGIAAFIIKRGTPGLSTTGLTLKMGQDGAPIGEIFLENCNVPASAIIGGEPERGVRTVMTALNKQRINSSALSTGPAI